MSMRVALVVGVVFGVSVANVSCREPCSLDTCAGCCDRNNDCQLGTEGLACGKRGALCEDCGGGQCLKQVCVVRDAGPEDAGVEADGGCLPGTCGAMFLCNTTSGACETPGSCSVNQPQPAGCGSGHVCRAGTCADLARPSCSNFSPQSAPMRWNPAVSFGPAIVSAQARSFGLVDAGCPPGALRRGVAELEAYDFRRRFEDGGVPRLFLYRDNATLSTVLPEQIVSVTPSNDGANAIIQVSICAPDTVSSLVQGFAFEGGNGACVQFQ
ncbi:MAG: hypothetical protein JNM69_08015 [Archangium sp.]|nr:hypothetical protein [Archangium sp.]